MNKMKIFGDGKCSNRDCDIDLNSLDEIYVVYFPNRHIPNGELSYHKGYCCREDFLQSEDRNEIYEEIGNLDIENVEISRY